MHKVFTRLVFTLFVLVSVGARCQTTINPATQVRWPAVTGAGAPSSPTWPCTSTHYGQPYTDTTANTQYVCSTSGWVPVASTGGTGMTALTGPVTAMGPGSAASTITPTGVTAGTYSGAAITVNAAGQITFAGTPFTINTFTCNVCGTVEIGFTTASPASGSLSYSNPTTPTSASVFDGANTATLSTPFTSWSLAHTYASSTIGASTTFTATALGNAQTKTATQSVTWQPRYFGGVGAPGATSSVTASGTTAVLSTTDVLTSAGLADSQVGSVIGTYSPSGQSIYLLLRGGSHTFTDNNTGFAMAFNSPTAVTFVNQYGVSVSMFLYQTTFTLTGAFAPKVAS